MLMWSTQQNYPFLFRGKIIKNSIARTSVHHTFVQTKARFALSQLELPSFSRGRRCEMINWISCSEGKKKIHPYELHHFKPGNERQFARPMFQLFTSYVSLTYPSWSRKWSPNQLSELKTELISWKYGGYLLIKSVANANTQAIT